MCIFIFIFVFVRLQFVFLCEINRNQFADVIFPDAAMCRKNLYPSVVNWSDVSIIICVIFFVIFIVICIVMIFIVYITVVIFFAIVTIKVYIWHQMAPWTFVVAKVAIWRHMPYVAGKQLWRRIQLLPTF